MAITGTVDVTQKLQEVAKMYYSEFMTTHLWLQSFYIVYLISNSLKLEIFTCVGFEKKYANSAPLGFVANPLSAYM